MLLPVAFLLGLAAYARLVQINTVEFHLVLAMNRLRQAYARLEPGVVPFLTTGRTDDERGLVATYMLGDVGRTWLWIHFVVNTPTIVGTVHAAIAAVVTVLLLQLANAPAAMFVIAGGGVFGLIWLTLKSRRLGRF